MSGSPRYATVLVLGGLALALLAGCGSGTKTVTVSSAPPVAETTSTATQPTTGTATTSTSSTPPPTGTSGGSPAPSTTHTAPEPSFTAGETKAEGSGAAGAIVRERGYTPNNSSDYHAGQALRVITATRTGSADGYQQQAFFFVNGNYIGTDSKEPSAGVKVVSQSDTEVTLAYSLYRPNAPLSSPSGTAQVTFQLNNGKLVPLGKIPPASSAIALSRN